MTRHVIVGAGIAGLAAAEVLRARERDARITLVGAEPGDPYSRPGLAYLLAGVIPEAQLTIRSPEELARLQLERRTGEAVAVDPAGHTVTLADGEVLPYDRLLLALGAQALPPDFPGGELDGVVRLDHLAHARALLRRARTARSAVVVGGGPTAVELAEGLRAQGLRVHYLLRGDRYWSSVFDPVESEIVESALRRYGIVLRHRTRLVGAFGREGRLTGVETDAGEAIACDILAVAIGVAPRIGLAQAAGIAVGRGILVDAGMRTSAPDVYAAGDVAEVPDPDTGATTVDGLWSTALAQGRAAGRSMSGAAVAWSREPSLNVTRLGGIQVSIVGLAAPPESRVPDPDLQTLARGDSASWRIRGGGALRTRAGRSRVRVTVGPERVVGAVVLGDVAASRALCHLVRARVPIPDLRTRLEAEPDVVIDGLITLGEAALAEPQGGARAPGA